MKKAVAWLLGFMMVLSLTACGAKETKGEAGGQSAPDVTDGKEASGNEEISLSIILITGNEFFQGAIDDYCDQHPNVKVDVQIMDTESYKTIIKTKLASNDAPDILPVFSAADYFSYYENGYLEDLRDMTEILDRLNEGAISSFVADDGGIIGIPYLQQFLLAYYNKDMFAQYNLTAPATWEELINCCEVLKAAGITPVVQGHKDTWVTQMLTYSLNASAVQAADPSFYEGTADGTNKFSDNAGWLDTLTKYDDMIKKGYMNEGSLGMTSEQMYEAFINKEAAMTFTGTWGDASIFALNPDFEVGGFPIPAEGGSTGFAVSITGGWGVSADSENVEAAKDLLAYILSKEALETYASSQITCFSDIESGVSDALAETMDAAAGLPGYPFDDANFASGVQAVMFSSIQEMIGGDKTPVEVLNDMDMATEKANK